MQKYLLNVITTFLIPLLVLYAPFKHSLIALGMLLLINYILSVIAQIKVEQGSFINKLLVGMFHRNSLVETILITFNRSVGILLVSLFEAYFLHIDISELATKFISFTHFMIVYVAYKEVRRGLELNKKITGLDLYEELLPFISEKFKKY